MFSKILKRLRLEKNLTQSEMAKALNISRVTYTNYELGNREPDFSTVSRIAAVLGTSVDYLLGISAVKTPKGDFTSQTGGTLSPSLRLIMLSASALSSESRDDLQRYIELLKIKDEAGRKIERKSSKKHDSNGHGGKSGRDTQKLNNMED